MTVLEVIQRSTQFLAKKGVESPRLQIELMLAHVLQLPRLKLYLNFDRPLDETQVTALREMVSQRGERIPLQHILGTAPFLGFELQVNRHVLVPRPETELLAECARQWLDATRDPQGESRVALDYGTGSGCLAIALALHAPQLQVHAVDLSPDALSVAKENAARLQVGDRIQFVESDGLQNLPPTSQFHLVVSNPPYIPTEEIASLDPEVKDHDPRLALDGGADGLTFYRRLASELPPRMFPGGRLMLELGDGQADSVSSLLESQNWVVEGVRQDYSSRPRVLVAVRQ